MSHPITLAMIRTSLSAAVVCDALDAMGHRGQSPRVAFHAFGAGQLLAGRCRTTLWADVVDTDPRPYELELRALDACQADDVMVCAAGGSLLSALWGELLTTAAQRAGCAGAVVDGAVRDVARIQQQGFPVFARGTSVYDSLHRQRAIDIDVPVEIGGVWCRPGDLVLADRDGAVVVPREIEEEAIQRAWNKVHAEDAVREAIRRGMSASEAYQRYGVL
jgi:4-hydroxy-4-methyl-2-oxoglutarate aldolase